MTIKTVSFPFQGWPVKLELAALDDKSVSGTVTVTDTSVAFQMGTGQQIQSLLPMNIHAHPLFAGQRRTPTRKYLARQFAYAAVSHWLRNVVSDNPAPASHKEIDPADAHYISRLLKAGHLRVPCVKRSPKSQSPFVCNGAIVNAARYTEPEKLARTRTALEVLNEKARAYANDHGFDVGNFRTYVRSLLQPEHFA